MTKFTAAALILLSSTTSYTDAFSPVPTSPVRSTVSSLEAKRSQNDLAKLAATFIIGATLSFPNGAALADEYGRETEAPTLFTGETVLICTKRGPLGACLKTTERTVENDNDKASKYFRDPGESMKERYSAAQLQTIDETEGNELIEKLRQQSVDNKERNDKIIRMKTLQNDLGASFGPLDQQVVILNSDGENFTLLKGAQAMRLKKAGYIKDKRFVTQPTQEVIDAALEAPEESGGIGGMFGKIFGGGDGF